MLLVSMDSIECTEDAKRDYRGGAFSFSKGYGRLDPPTGSQQGGPRPSALFNQIPSDLL